MIGVLKRQPPARIIALGFLILIFLGAGLLMLPCSVKDGVELKFIDSLYTSTSAVCVTGLVVVDAADTFTLFGQIVLAVLIQFGGLGVTTVGAGIILAMGKKVNLKGRTLIREAMNVGSGKGLIKLIREIFFVTIIIEALGAILSFTVFVQDYSPPRALWISIFHSIAAFNNAGFDVLGGFQSLIPYKDNILINVVTCVLIFFGGIGFLVIREVWDKKLNFKKFSMHTKVVLSMSAILIVSGAVLIKLSEEISWLGAFFASISARTAGFSTYSFGGFSKAGILVMSVLMLIGASPGSTGGGVKTTTFFVMIKGIFSAATNRSEKAFRYSVPKEAFKKASVIIFMALGIICIGVYLMCLFEPAIDFVDIVFENVSAFATVGLSTGITPGLGIDSKILSIIIMYIGRLGPMTIATLWYFSKGERISYPEGNITIG